MAEGSGCQQQRDDSHNNISHLISEGLGAIRDDTIIERPTTTSSPQHRADPTRVELQQPMEEDERSPSIDLYSVVEPLDSSYQQSLSEENSHSSPFKDQLQLTDHHLDSHSIPSSETQPSPSHTSVAPTTIVAPQLQTSPMINPPVTPGATPVPPPKVHRFCTKHPHIEITLDGKELWDQFYQKGTEMIVNRSGRRMFPGFSVSIAGLKPKTKYTMKLDVVLADNHRFKFLNARWLAVGSSEPQSPFETYIHTDSPNTGSFWMRHGISFRKLKITNNKDKPGQNALLHSMHKYFVRLLIEEERKTAPGEQKQPSRPILSVEFPETTFIAVTAYQNEEVTQLKISNNPFAKAFRENAADIDWETSQALYSPNYLSGGSTGSYYPPAWGIQSSPLLSPSPLTPTLQHHAFQTHQHFTPHHHLQLHHQPLSAGGQMQYSPDSPMLNKPPPSAGGGAASGGTYFQWPTYKSETSSSSSTCYQQAQLGFGAVTVPTSNHHEESHTGIAGTAAAAYHQFHYSSTPTTQLPDFDSAFTTPVVSMNNVYNNPS